MSGGALNSAQPQAQVSMTVLNLRLSSTSFLSRMAYLSFCSTQQNTSLSLGLGLCRETMDMRLVQHVVPFYLVRDTHGEA